MDPFPPTPPVEDAPPPLFDRGHLFVSEAIDGLPLRFRMAETGLLQFGDRDRVFRSDPPLPYRAATRHVRDHLDRDAFREAVGRAGDLTVFGVATVRRGIDYDWTRMPPFLGVDVRSADHEALLSPDLAEKVIEGVGLTAVNHFEREVSARHFHPGAYAVPASAWYDGPAAGALVRNKRGERAHIEGPAAETEPSDTDSLHDATPAVLAERFATDERLERVRATVADRGDPVTVETVLPRLLETVAREAHRTLDSGGIDLADGPVRSAMAARVQSTLDR